MAAVRTDRLDVPSGTHDERVLAWTHALAVDTLAPVVRGQSIGEHANGGDDR